MKPIKTASIYREANKAKIQKQRSEYNQTPRGIAIQLVGSCRHTDKKYNRYQEDGYITMGWCLTHLDNPKLMCHYCSGVMAIGTDVDRTTHTTADGHHDGLTLEIE